MRRIGNEVFRFQVLLFAREHEEVEEGAIRWGSQLVVVLDVRLEDVEGRHRS